MTKNKLTRTLIDSLMLILFIFEMSQREGRNIFLHAVLGTVLFALFIAHNILNIAYYKSLFRGKYPPRRVAMIAIDTALVLSLLVLIFSSVQISGMAFSFLPFKFEWLPIHKAAASWMFVIMAFHLGLHTNGLFNKIERRFSVGLGKWICFFCEILIFALGVFFFIKSRLWSAMIFYDRYVEVPPVPIFFLEYALIIAGACGALHFMLKRKGR